MAATMSKAEFRAQRGVLREVVSRRPTLPESRSGTLLRRYLGTALCAVVRREGPSRRGVRDGSRENGPDEDAR